MTKIVNKNESIQILKLFEYNAGVFYPESDMDSLAALLDSFPLKDLLAVTETDYTPESLLRALLLREFYNMSYEIIASSLKRDLIFMKFCGFSVSGPKPDATTLGRFRDRMIRNGLWEKCLAVVNTGLEEAGLKIKTTVYVADATLIPSARRPRKAYTVDGEGNVTGTEYSDDPDATYKAKGGEPIYGYGGTFITDREGLVENTTIGSAHESEMTNFETDVVDKIPAGSRILYDKGADSAHNRKVCARKGVKEGIMKKKPKGRPMSPMNKRRNRIISKQRFVAERTFGTMKRVYGMARAKLIGLEKVTSEVLSKSIAYNLRRASKSVIPDTIMAYAG